jgi:hypothetical protein
LLPFAGVAFLWFIAVVRDRVGELEDRFFATVFLGSGLLFIAMMFNVGALAGGLIDTLGSRSGDLIQSGTYGLSRAEILSDHAYLCDEDGRGIHDQHFYHLATNPDIPALDGHARVRTGASAPAEPRKDGMVSAGLPGVGIPD